MDWEMATPFLVERNLNRKGAREGDGHKENRNQLQKPKDERGMATSIFCILLDRDGEMANPFPNTSKKRRDINF